MRSQEFTSFSSKAIADAKRAELEKRTKRRSARLERGKRSQVEVVICSRSRFESQAEAAQWARDHDFSASRPQATSAGWKFVQPVRPAGPTYEVTLDEGVTAMVQHGG